MTTIQPTLIAHPWLNGGRVFDQVGIVVRDMHATLEFFTKTLRIGPWRVYSHGPGLEARMWGRPAAWEVWLAFSPWDTQPQIELIQPVSGDSLHHRFLAERGEGIQHFGMRPADYDTAYRTLVDEGFECAQETSGYGKLRDGRNAYFDTRPLLFGAMLELMSPPSVRPDPLEEWSLPDDPPEDDSR
jgi:catechol 2,3-dioxygenase-like lactoylglutathione lyase family enzyme